MRLNKSFGTYVLVVLLLAPFTLSSTAQELPSADDPYWIEDQASGCLAANPSPVPNETINWDGACVNGLIEGDGVLTWHEGGDFLGRDSGNFAAGRLSGEGKIETAEGWSYEGRFPGSGIMRFPDGEEVPAQAVGRNSGWRILQTHERGL
jgi:hypothetical protein